jgi:trk system potassium uptake protein TrkA
MDLETLERAGVAGADAVVVSTDGDNTNLVVAQVVKRRYDVGCVVVRILDPHRAALYSEWGLRTVCPTQTAIATVTDLVRTCETAPVARAG